MFKNTEPEETGQYGVLLITCTLGRNMYLPCIDFIIYNIRTFSDNLNFIWATLLWCWLFQISVAYNKWYCMKNDFYHMFCTFIKDTYLCIFSSIWMNMIYVNLFWWYIPLFIHNKPLIHIKTSWTGTYKRLH